MPETSQHGAEPIKAVRDMMRTSDVIFAPTTHSLTHTRARRGATKAGARIASMPGISTPMMSSGGMTADFKEIRSRIMEVHTKVKGKRTVKIITELGTDLSFSIEKRLWITEDTGICRKKGSFTNLPAGEIFIAPVEGTASGTLVVDGSFMGLLDEPITVGLENGHAVTFSGKGHDGIEKMMKATGGKMKDPTIASHVAKFGIGLNPKSRIIGNILEDEKTLGTIHIGFGGNYSIGGRVHSGIVLEGIVRSPTVLMDDEFVIMDRGKLLV
jgi:leucyl aminopeptidase (aminopeptidase T)